MKTWIMIKRVRGWRDNDIWIIKVPDGTAWGGDNYNKRGLDEKSLDERSSLSHLPVSDGKNNKVRRKDDDEWYNEWDVIF